MEKNKIKEYIIYIIIFTLIYYLAYKCRNNINENLEESNSNNVNVDTEAIQNIASIYNNEELITKNATITDSLVVKNKFNFLPRGIITAWTGEEAPEGWGLCDGTNNTPDLRGRFIYGYNNTKKDMNKIGGTENVRISIQHLPEHNHPHHHKLSWQGSTISLNNNVFSAGNRGGYKPNDGDPVYTSYDMKYPIKLTEEQQNLSDFKNNIMTNMPPYYTLAYIMKL